MDMNNQICQSCGMPLRKESDFGTDRTGSRNMQYCHFCYQYGSFRDDGISMEEKIEKNIAMAIKRGISAEKAKEQARRIIPKLARWQKK